ncbi:MAG TPA: hypothetical protein VE712_01480 [Actinomycetota bacterium]|nr:hypothetical protein [Actinomycetota bacterium]
MRRLSAVAVGLLVAGLIAPAAHSAEPRRCFGERSTITGGAADERLVGTSGRDVISAGSGSDVVIGRGGNDLLCGGFGGDTMFGGRGNDKVTGGPTPFNLVDGGPGDDYLLGFGTCCAELTGGDTVSYRNAPGPVTVDLLAGKATGQGTDTVVNFAGIDGSNFGDRLIASDSFPGDAIRGFGGNDVIIGFDGFSNNGEVFLGGGGDDTIRGRDGYEFLVGGSGDDVLSGGPNNTPQGWGPIGDEAVYGGALFTALWIWEGRGGPVVVDLANNVATGQGSDTLLGIEDVTGSSHNDMLLGDARDNVLIGEDGTDTINGRGGNDSCDGEVEQNCE